MMCKEAATLPDFEHTMDTGSFESVQSLESIATMLRFLSVTRTAQVALVSVTLRFEHNDSSHAAPIASAEQSARYYFEHLRTLIRRTDVVVLHEHTFYFILLDASLEGGSIVQERLWDALLWRVHNIADEHILRPATMSIGHSAYPTPYRDSSRCIAAAREVRHSFKLELGTNRVAACHSADEELPEKARKLGIPYLSSLPHKPSTRALSAISPQLARELHCFPLGRERDTLTVAIPNPEDQRLLGHIEQITGMRIFPVLIDEHELQDALEKLI